MMRYGLWSSRRTFTASELAILSHATGALRPPHPVASTITLTNSRLRIRSLPSSLTRVVRRRALGQPIPKRRPPSPRAQGQAPLFEDRQCHRAHAAFRRSRGRALLEQPRLELIRVWVGGDGAVEQIALDREADRIGRRVALTTLPPAFRGFEGGEQLAADGGRSWRLVEVGGGWWRSHVFTASTNLDQLPQPSVPNRIPAVRADDSRDQARRHPGRQLPRRPTARPTRAARSLWAPLSHSPCKYRTPRPCAWSRRPRAPGIPDSRDSSRRRRGSAATAPPSRCRSARSATSACARGRGTPRAWARRHTADNSLPTRPPVRQCRSSGHIPGAAAPPRPAPRRAAWTDRLSRARQCAHRPDGSRPPADRARRGDWPHHRDRRAARDRARTGSQSGGGRRPGRRAVEVRGRDDRSPAPARRRPKSWRPGTRLEPPRPTPATFRIQGFSAERPPGAAPAPRLGAGGRYGARAFHFRGLARRLVVHLVTGVHLHDGTVVARISTGSAATRPRSFGARAGGDARRDKQHPPACPHDISPHRRLRGARQWSWRRTGRPRAAGTRRAGPCLRGFGKPRRRSV